MSAGHQTGLTSFTSPDLDLSLRYSLVGRRARLGVVAFAFCYFGRTLQSIAGLTLFRLDPLTA